MNKDKIKEILKKSKEEKEKAPKTEEKQAGEKVDIRILCDDAVFRNELLIRLDFLNATLQELNKKLE